MRMKQIEEKERTLNDVEAKLKKKKDSLDQMEAELKKVCYYIVTFFKYILIYIYLFFFNI